jgi:hypothetical protein
MRDCRPDNIFDKDDALDFIIYEEIETYGQERKGAKGGCLGVVVLLLLPAVSVMLLSWK